MWRGVALKVAPFVILDKGRTNREGRNRSQNSDGNGFLPNVSDFVLYLAPTALPQFSKLHLGRLRLSKPRRSSWASRIL